MNPSLKKNPMPTQPADVRNKNFSEVALGYTEETAISEAQRCLNCKNALCMTGCPVKVKIPRFIEKVAAGDFESAYKVITEDNLLPAICGRVCPQETQCESKCVRAIKGESVGIGRLERFVADYHRTHTTEKLSPAERNGKKIAVIGSGPSGLACAGYLAKKGYAVTVFEAMHVSGGVLSYGIPEFRLPKDIVKKEISDLKDLGVEFITNVVIGKTMTVRELRKEYEAVFIGSGAGLPSFLGIPGESANGVYSANEFLTRINLMKAYKEDSPTPVYRAKKTVVFGGGNVAMDAARCAKRLGSDVSIVYRRTENELPARKEEIEHAKEEGIAFEFLTAPLEILKNADGWVESVKCQKMELGEPDASGRRRPVPIENSEFTIGADCVIVAIGTTPNPLIKNTTKDLEINKKGGIVVAEETGKTSIDGVYAGGDAVTGAATVILAMGAGKTAGKAIDEYLNTSMD
ncbi:MAG: NADPH-dependent glutamate synthase [Clostridia bacterium]|nr:NADPH-dependent glutamate synthase [Clostridia bacterium]